MADYNLVELDNSYKDVFRVTIDGTHDYGMVARTVNYLSMEVFEEDAVALAKLRDNYSCRGELANFFEFGGIYIPMGDQGQCHSLNNLEYVYIDNDGVIHDIELRRDGTYDILNIEYSEIKTDMFNVMIQLDYGDGEYTSSRYWYDTETFNEISDIVRKLYDVKFSRIGYDDWFVYVNEARDFGFHLPELPPQTAPHHVYNLDIYYIDHLGKIFNVEFI